MYPASCTADFWFSPWLLSGSVSAQHLQVMQVKNFGRRGRTKYTHLADQDTTARDDYYTQEGIKQPNRRLAGTDQIFEKPKKFNT